MTRETVNAICGALPGAEWSDPWGGGHDAWKVGGKLFAVIGAVDARLSVKTESVEVAEMLIEAGIGQPVTYFHRSWIALPLDTPVEELRHRIGESYRVIRASLPKKVQAALMPAVLPSSS
ncbi:MmcQ/YjbR family DNA-binding protein [Paracoccus sp. S-4012]|uniref:MmcQ/YjbR family DNA-binding protein n=1 Tax=Paracoccus sp. S-4012 TaxID=2665648 RepID=UPI0012AFE63B|nr:MmcQ/YjbR family DNA-binding protein [Paracoccus sp. S-4012]MRX51832.1 MmcQ/YjbR family DNA-binding protein [Paracoccus sp. S-4012]